MQDLTLRGRTKKVQVLREGTKKGQRVVTPQADKSDRIWAIHQLQIPHMVVEMQMMKERMDCMMNALRGQVSSDLDELVHWTDSPFTTSVTSFPFPPKFRMLQIEAYDGSKDPLESFKTLMHMQGVEDKIMCRTFPTTLKDPARVWFSRLTFNSISTFKELSAQFASHFIEWHRYKRSTTYLMNINQRGDETLKSYITRFNKDPLNRWS